MNRLPSLNDDATTNGHVATTPSVDAPLVEAEGSCQEELPLPNGDFDVDRLLAKVRKAFPGKPVRNSKGRFVRGNPGGPGNPFARQVAAYRRALCDALTEGDLRQLAKTLLANALEGDTAAAALLMAYVIGKPTEAVDPDRLDRNEWDRMKESAIPPNDLMHLVDHFPAAVHCRIARVAWPIFVKILKQKFADAMRNPPDLASFPAPEFPLELPTLTNPSD